MGYFSTALTQIMEQKESVNNEVIRHTGINRSTFFKIKSGSRDPSGYDMVDKIVRALRLNEEHSRILMDAYEMDKLGEYKYFGFKAVQQIFQSRAAVSGNSVVNISLLNLNEGESFRIFRDEIEIRAAICGVLNDESAQIRIMESYMSDVYLSGIPQASAAHPETEFFHMFMLNDSDTVGIDNQLYNIKSFQKVIEILVRTDMYKPQYYYVPISSFSKNVQHNNFILSDRHLLAYNGVEYQDIAILYEDPKILELYREIYERGFKHSMHLVETSSSGESREENLKKDLSKPDEIGEIYFCLPGISSVAVLEEDDELFRSIFRKNLKLNKKFVEYFQYMHELVKKGILAAGDACHLLIYADSMEDFALTGKFRELPAECIETFEEEKRIAFLRKWRSKSTAYKIETVKGNDSERFSFFAAASMHEACILTINECDMTVQRISVSEPSIVDLIYGYLERLGKNNVLDRKQTFEFIEGLVMGIAE